MGVTPFAFSKKPSLGTPIGDQMSEKTVIGRLGWRRLGLSNTLFVLLCSCVCVGVVPLGLGGGGSSQATRRTWFTVNIPSGDGSARKVVRAAPAAAVRRKQPLSSGNFTNGGGPGGGGSSQATALQRELYERRRPRRRRFVASNRSPAGTLRTAAAAMKNGMKDGMKDYEGWNEGL